MNTLSRSVMPSDRQLYAEPRGENEFNQRVHIRLTAVLAERLRDAFSLSKGSEWHYDMRSIRRCWVNG
jgi:hypothetical protein